MDFTGGPFSGPPLCLNATFAGLYLHRLIKLKSEANKLCRDWSQNTWNQPGRAGTSREGGARRCSPETLLARRVPDLQLDPFARLDLHQPGEEIHADGRVRHLGEAALREAADQTRLPHRRVPDDDQPELIEPYGLHVTRHPAACLPVCLSVHRRERERGWSIFTMNYLTSTHSPDVKKNNTLNKTALYLHESSPDVVSVTHPHLCPDTHFFIVHAACFLVTDEKSALFLGGCVSIWTSKSAFYGHFWFLDLFASYLHGNLFFQQEQNNQILNIKKQHFSDYSRWMDTKKATEPDARPPFHRPFRGP